MAKVEAKDIVSVTRHWSHKDDWNVDSIYIGTLRELIGLLERGVTATQIIAHAGHKSEGCCFVQSMMD